MNQGGWVDNSGRWGSTFIHLNTWTLYICTFSYLHIIVFSFQHCIGCFHYHPIDESPCRGSWLKKKKKSCLCWFSKSTLWHFLELLWKWRCLGVAFTFIEYGNRCINTNTHKETLHADGWPLMLASAPLSISRINGPHWASSSVGLEHQRKLIKITSALSPVFWTFSLFFSKNKIVWDLKGMWSPLLEIFVLFILMFLSRSKWSQLTLTYL